MGFQVTWVPADDTISSTLLLCNSSRSIAEHNVRFSGKPVSETVDLFRSRTVANFYRFNRRTPLNFEVLRDQDFSGNSFPDPEAAIAFAADHCGGVTKDNAIAGTGILRVVLTGSVTNKTLTFNNVVLAAGIDLIDWTGISITFRYDFMTASVTTT